MILTKLLQLFLFNFTNGAGRVTADALWLLALFFGGELIVTGITFVLTREFQFREIVWKSIMAGFFVWLITNWSTVTRVLIKGFIQAGLKIGGDVISETDFTDPDNIALYGLSVTAVVFHHLSDYAGLDALKNIVEILGSGVTAWLVVVFYFAMAVIIFITLLEFYLGTAITVILLPWGMFSKTAWLTEKALAYVFASGVRLLVLATILGTALPFLYGNAQSLGTGFDAVWRQLLGAGALLGLCWKANSIAQGFVYGGPALVLADAGVVIQHLNIQVTRLGNAIQGLADLMARSDPNHPARQAAVPGRRV